MSVEVLTVSIPEAGQMLGISRNQAYECAKRGEIPTIKLGARIVVPRVALMRMLEGASQPRDSKQQQSATEAV
jgi:excisionase family DNA binding protein